MAAGVISKVRTKIAALRHRGWLRECRAIDGWLTDAEAIALYDLARRLSAPARILEIGSWKGKSTFALASGLTEGVIFALDPFDGSGEPDSRQAYENSRGSVPLLAQFKTNLSRRGLWNKIAVRQGYSKDFAGSFQDLDLVFIDGDHSREGCAYDFTEFGKAVKPGGYLAFHDYDPARPDLGPTWTVENLVQQSGNWIPVGQWDSLIVIRRSTR